ncbi:MAG: hypothetical protein AAGA30_10380 [Planctomycetota bacterium]
MNRRKFWICCVMVTSCCQILPAQTDQKLSERTRVAAENLAKKQKYELKYRFEQGEEIRWNVEHVASTKAQIAGKHEETSSRTQSKKLWRVKNIDSRGNITFVHSVESIVFWQKLGDEEPISYDTESGEPTPESFAPAVEKIGKPLAVVTISPQGKVIDRKSGEGQFSFGVGDICTPLPEGRISIGHRWFVPTEFNATDEDGKRLTLKARLNYQLSRVVDSVAVISFRTEVLSPIESDQVRSQLLQKLNSGYVAFDLEFGRLTTKEVKWNEKVHEYAGPDSFLQYTGRMTEKLALNATDKKKASNKVGSRTVIKKRGEKPIIRK